MSDANAAQAIQLALECQKELWYEAFSIVDDLEHIDNSKAKTILGYIPEVPSYPAERVRSGVEARAVIAPHKTGGDDV